MPFPKQADMFLSQAFAHSGPSAWDASLPHSHLHAYKSDKLLRRPHRKVTSSTQLSPGVPTKGKTVSDFSHTPAQKLPQAQSGHSGNHHHMKVKAKAMEISLV